MLTTTREEKYRNMLIEIAQTLERWASESVRGGWSTHQVEAQRALASKIKVKLFDEEIMK